MKLLKNVKYVLLVLLMNFNIYAAIVSDNDGSAFITKAEYDSLKNNFQSQIDYYNTSIDNKIDSAIASYISGINIERVAIETFIGNGHSTREFVRNFKLNNTNRIGDYVEGYSAVGMEGCNNDTTYFQTGYFNMSLMTLDTGVAAEPRKVSIGTNKDTFLYIQDSTWDSTYKVCSGQLECIPFTAWFGYYTNHSATPLSTNFTRPSNFIIERVDSEHWGFQSGSMSVSMGDKTLTAQPNAVFTSLDVLLNEYNIECLAGSTVPSSILYTLHIDDKSKLGDPSTYVPINKGWARVRYNGSNPTDVSNTWIPEGAYKLKTYHHKIHHTYALTDLVIDTMSSLLNRPIKYYNGLPLFKASQDGNVELTLKISNDGNETSKVAVKSGSFDNVSFVEGISLDSTSADWSVDGTKVWPSSFISNQEYKLKFDVKKGSYYFIKVLPSTEDHNSVVNIVGDIKNTSNN